MGPGVFRLSCLSCQAGLFLYLSVLFFYLLSVFVRVIRGRFLLGGELVFEDAEAVDFYLDAVAGLNGSYS